MARLRAIAFVINRLLLIGSFGLFTTTCSSLVSEAPVDDTDIVEVAVFPTVIALDTNATQAFTATALTALGNTVPSRVTWSVTGGAIDQNGVFTAPVQGGDYMIIATHPVRGWLADTASATVTASVVIPPAPLQVSPASAVLRPGDSATFRAIEINIVGDTTAVPVTWSTTNPGGTFTPVATGVTRFVAGSEGQHVVVATAAGGAADSADVSVSSLPVASVLLSPNPFTLTVGGTVAVTATARDSLGSLVSGNSVSWVSRSPNVVTVNPVGLVTGLAVGAGYVVVTVDGVSDSTLATVSAVSVASVQVTPNPLTLEAGTSATLFAVTRDAAGLALPGRTVTWASVNPGIAWANSGGIVTGVQAGTTMVIAVSEGVNDTVAVNVIAPPVATVQIAPTGVSLVVNATQQLSATMRDARGGLLFGRTVVWSSQDSAVATVATGGIVRGISPGTTTVIATSEGQADSVAVTVTPSVASVSITPNVDSVPVGAALTLAVALLDGQGNPVTRPVTWVSTSPGIATVTSGGVVTGVTVGTAVITATSEGVADSATIGVTGLGAIVATVTGLTGAVPDGGSITATAVAGVLVGQSAQTVTVPQSGTVSQPVPPGDYYLAYTPPSSFQMSSGAADTVTVTVAQSQTVNIGFSVLPIPPVAGTLEVQVSGIGGGVSTGGSVAVTGISVPYPTDTIGISASGSMQQGLNVGTYTVRYAAPNGHVVNGSPPNPQTVTITASQTTVATFDVTDVRGGSGSAGDLYEHSFEDNTGGQYVSGVRQDIILTPTAWSIDSNTAARGTKSVRQTYNACACNVGEPFFFELPSNPITTSFYLRFAFRQSAGFNGNNQDIEKIIRAKRANFYGNFGSLIIRGGGEFVMTWEEYSGSNQSHQSQTPNQGVRANANDYLGQWIWIEYYIELVNPTTGIQRLWINGVLTHDYTFTDLNIAYPELGGVQFDGTINSMVGTGTVWFDHVGFGTQRMGIP